MARPDDPARAEAKRRTEMSDTPRADAEALKWGPYEGQMNIVLPTSFARQLERELAAVSEERDHLREKIRNTVETADRDYCEMRNFQGKFIKASQENARLRTLLDEVAGALEYYIDNGDDHKTIAKAKAVLTKLDEAKGVN